jgi:hypothetical protein
MHAEGLLDLEPAHKQPSRTQAMVLGPPATGRAHCSTSLRRRNLTGARSLVRRAHIRDADAQDTPHATRPTVGKLDEAKESGGLWYGCFEFRAEDVPTAQLVLDPGEAVSPESRGWVFQCVCCDRLGFVVDVDRGGSRVVAVREWPSAPEPRTVVVRAAQLAAIFHRLDTLQTQIEEVEDKVGGLPAALWDLDATSLRPTD